LKKLLISLMIIGSVILISFIAFKLNSAHYKKLADDRIEKVIELQGADIEKAEIHMDRYDYFDSGYVKYIYFNDDAEIEYRYIYERPSDMVYVSAFSGNASLDLTDKKAKYDHFIHVFFDSNGTIKNVETR
jgi:hypothetical protein